MNFLAYPLLLYLVGSTAELPCKVHYLPYGVLCPIQPNLRALISLLMFIFIMCYYIFVACFTTLSVADWLYVTRIQSETDWSSKASGSGRKIPGRVVQIACRFGLQVPFWKEIQNSATRKPPFTNQPPLCLTRLLLWDFLGCRVTTMSLRSGRGVYRRSTIVATRVPCV
jgi:hypothetical protein